MLLVVHSLSCTPTTAASKTSPTISRSLPKFTSIESVMSSNHLILSLPLLLLLSIFPSIRVFSSESVLRIRWPKYRSISFSLSPSSEYSGVISFRIDWFDLLAVQGTLESPLVCPSYCKKNGSEHWATCVSVTVFSVCMISHVISACTLT